MRTDNLDLCKYIRRVIGIMWLTLGVLSLAKTFGHNFNIECEWENLSLLGSYADQNLWAKIVIHTIITYVITYFLYCCEFGVWQLKSTTATQLVIFVTAANIIKSIVTDILICMTIDAVLFVAIPVLIHPTKILKILKGFLFLGGYYTFSCYVKGVNIQAIVNMTSICVIYLLDVVIAALLYYVYYGVQRIYETQYTENQG